MVGDRRPVGRQALGCRTFQRPRRRPVVSHRLKWRRPPSVQLWDGCRSGNEWCYVFRVQLLQLQRSDQSASLVARPCVACLLSLIGLALGLVADLGHFPLALCRERMSEMCNDFDSILVVPPSDHVRGKPRFFHRRFPRVRSLKPVLVDRIYWESQ